MKEWPCHQYLESIWSEIALDPGRRVWRWTSSFRGRVPQRRKSHHRQRYYSCDYEWDCKPGGHGRSSRWMHLRLCERLARSPCAPRARLQARRRVVGPFALRPVQTVHDAKVWKRDHKTLGRFIESLGMFWTHYSRESDAKLLHIMLVHLEHYKEYLKMFSE